MATVLWGGPSAYVTLTTTQDDSVVGVLYENGPRNATWSDSCYRRISYTNVSIVGV